MSFIFTFIYIYIQDSKKKCRIFFISGPLPLLDKKYKKIYKFVKIFLKFVLHPVRRF